MRITKQGFVYQLTFMPRLFPVNCYFVEESDHLTLIDTALPYSTVGIKRAAERIGKPIRTIVLTHAHSDHLGALDSLKKQLPQVKVHISHRDAQLLRGNLSLLEHEPSAPIKGGVPKVGQILTQPDHLVAEGDRIGSLRVIETPGHTPGSISLIDTRSGALLAGDAFQTRGGIAVSGQRVLWFPFPAMATWHAETALHSARKLLAEKPTLLAVGHGQMLTSPLAHMQSAMLRAEQRLEVISSYES